MSRITQVASDFIAFWRSPVDNLIDALNDEQIFVRTVSAIGVAGLVVIGVTL